MNLTIKDTDAQWLAVACARAHTVFPGGSEEAKIFQRSLQKIIAALERKAREKKR